MFCTRPCVLTWCARLDLGYILLHTVHVAYITGINCVSLLHFLVERASNSSVSLSLFPTHAQNIFLSIVGFGLPRFRTGCGRRRAGGKNLLDLVRAIKPAKCSLVETLC